jgi:hypothetical protein
MYNETLKPIKMAESTSKIQDLRMEPATNGVIISYCVKKEKATKNTYDNCSYDYKKEVYDFDMGEKEEGGEKKDIDGAFERFKELWKQAHMTSM